MKLYIVEVVRAGYVLAKSEEEAVECAKEIAEFGDERVTASNADARLKWNDDSWVFTPDDSAVQLSAAKYMTGATW